MRRRKAEWMKHVGADGVNHDYYENAEYYNKPKLVRPYAVGMACAFCHVSSRSGASAREFRRAAVGESQRLRRRAVSEGVGSIRAATVIGAESSDSFVWQLIHSNPPGTLDTSFIATDYLNNPGTMNGIYNLPQRRLARAAAEET